jgi:thymidine kinase
MVLRQHRVFARGTKMPDLSMYVLVCHNCGSKKLRSLRYDNDYSIAFSDSGEYSLECAECYIEIYPAKDLKLRPNRKVNKT